MSARKYVHLTFVGADDNVPWVGALVTTICNRKIRVGGSELHGLPPCPRCSQDRAPDLPILTHIVGWDNTPTP